MVDSIPKLVSIEFAGTYTIRGYLTDGTTRELDFESYLHGPLLVSLRESERFREATVDATGTLVWPNGADVAPEAWILGFPEEGARGS
jgi:hypothetical protein